MAMTKSSKATMAEASGQKLLDVAVTVIRAKGYSAASVEDICAEAGLTKGAFFHHFQQGNEGAPCAGLAMDAGKRGALFTGCSPGRVHSRQGQARP
jgi:TetR/AcrR family transcriptional regulator, transcriptional repressor for nem operon